MQNLSNNIIAGKRIFVICGGVYYAKRGLLNSVCEYLQAGLEVHYCSRFS